MVGQTLRTELLQQLQPQQRQLDSGQGTGIVFDLVGGWRGWQDGHSLPHPAPSGSCMVGCDSYSAGRGRTSCVPAEGWWDQNCSSHVQGGASGPGEGGSC